MSKIVYLIEQPLDERNYDRFGIQTWIDRGWDVEVWDLTPWAHPRVWQNFIESGRKFREFVGYFPIASKSELAHRYSKLEKIGHFIDLTGDNNHTIRAKMYLIRMGAIRVICATGTMPEPDGGQKIGLVSKLGKALAKGPIKAFDWLAETFFRKLAVPFIRPGLVIVSGQKSIPSFSVAHEYQILEAHNLDYDLYLELTKSADVPTGEYAVFIDQDYCFHPDFIFQDIPFLVTPEKYFPAICNGLRKISDVLAVGLRVAAHPRSSYRQKIPDYFEGIPIEYGGTAELIRNCKAVVCHNSTAIQFAVLFEKPLIFLTTDELNSSYAGRSIAIFASELGKSVINLDGDLDSVNWREALSVNLEKYAAYRNKYVKISGSPELPHWDIVIDHIEKTARPASADLADRCASASGSG